MRFDVFHRDGFACQYCGMTPPEAILHLDHIVPHSKGGSDEIDNLITACSRCNGGKSDKDLKKVPPKVKKNIEELTERYDQMVEFYKYQKKSEEFKKDALEDLIDYWFELWPQLQSISLREKASIASFLEHFSPSEIKGAMNIARSRVNYGSDGFKYMCGVLHTRRRERQESQEE